MRHIVLLFSILCYSSGLLSLGATAILLLKFRNVNIRRYLFIQLLFTLALSVITLGYYSSVIMYSQDLLNSIPLTLLYFLTFGALIFMIPSTIVSLSGNQMLMRSYWLLGLSLVVSAALGLIPFFFYPVRFELTLQVLKWLFWASVAFTCIYSFRRVGKSATPVSGKLFRLTWVTALVFLVSWLFENVTARIPSVRFSIQPGVYSPFLENTVSFFIVYLVWNALSMVGAIRYFGYESAVLHPVSVPEAFVKQFNITAREKEIIEYILKGQDNNTIAEELNITLNTVKKHITNIFMKTEMKGRFELLVFIRSYGKAEQS